MMALDKVLSSFPSRTRKDGHVTGLNLEVTVFSSGVVSKQACIRSKAKAPVFSSKVSLGRACNRIGVEFPRKKIP
jgi:hypothetical protein